MSITIEEALHVALANKASMLEWQYDEILPRLVAQFMTFKEMLLVRQCCKTLYYSRRFRLHCVDLSEFSFVGETGMWHFLLPLAIRTCTPAALQRLSFKGCTLLTDQIYGALFGDASILPSTIIINPLAEKIEAEKKANPKDKSVDTEALRAMEIPHDMPIVFTLNLKALYLDYCPLVTDRTLSLLLNTNMPVLEKLSFRCVRSNRLTGEPFASKLDKTRWPRMHELDVSFTHMSLQALDTVTSFMLARSLETETTAKVKIEGSLASISFFKMLGLEELHKTFQQNVDSGVVATLSKTVDFFVESYQGQVSSTALKRMVLCRILRNECLNLLLNAPFLMGINDEKKKIKETRDVKKEKSKETTKERDKESTTVVRWTYPLYNAVRKGQYEMVEFLVDRGAALNVVDYDGGTPLYVAAACASQDSKGQALRMTIMEYLISKGASLSALDVNSKKWPLNAAVKYDNTIVLERLIKAGAPVNYPGHSYGNLAGGPGPKGPIIFGLECDNIPKKCILKLILAGSDIIGLVATTISTNVSPILLIYVKAKDLLPHALSKLRVDDEDNRIFECLTELLSIAIGKEDLDTMKLLIDSIPALLETQHKIWSYPIHQISKLQHTGIIAYLIKAYKDNELDKYLNDRDKNGRSPLIVSVSENNATAVNALIKAGCDLNTMDADGTTPLMVCAENNQWTLAYMLMQNGADVNARNEDGSNALMIAAKHRQEKISLRLIECYEDINLDLNAVDNDGRTALILFIYYGVYTVAHALIDAGCDPSIADGCGNTAETILKQKLEATHTPVTQGIKNSFARTMGKLSRRGRSESSSRHGGTRRNESVMTEHNETESTEEKSSFYDMARIEASVSLNDLTDEALMTEMMEKKHKAGQQLMKKLKEVTKQRTKQ